MTTLVDHYCERCLREPSHEQRDGLLICTECGTVTSWLDRPSNGIGVSDRGASSEGESDKGDPHPSVLPRAYTATAYAEKLHGNDLAALDSDPEFARFVMTRAGLGFQQDEAQALLLGELTVELRLWVDDHDLYVLRPTGDGATARFPGTKIRALKLGQLYASVTAGHLIAPTRGALARWKRRALADGRFLDLPVVRLATLPEDAPRYLPQVWSGIELLAAVRRLVDRDETCLPLEWTFLADWCGCDEVVVRRSRAWLDRHGFIWRAGLVAIGKPKPMVLWAVAEQRI